jgi:hypothetical protein
MVQSIFFLNFFLKTSNPTRLFLEKMGKVVIFWGKKKLKLLDWDHSFKHVSRIYNGVPT